MQPERVSSTQTVGPYRLLERLGAGGMGEVFLAYDDRLDRRVAIKRIRSDAGISPERRERFRREARMAAGLSHPAIVQVFDILQENDTDSIVMEYVEGTNLRALVDGGPLDTQMVVELARELVDGLEAAHRSGIVHRDLKSENILVGPSGRPKVTDFGIAKRLFANDSEESLTGDHKLIGTCRSMSPEQARGEPVDHRTDLFAFGVLLYEMLAGRSPFMAETPLATLTRVLHHRQTPVRELVPAVPEALSHLVDHLLEKDANRRPRNAGQVRRELDRLALTLTGAGGTETILEILPSSGSSAQEADVAEKGPATGTASPPGPARRSVAVLVVLVILAGLGIPAYLALRPADPPLYVAVLAPEIGAGAGNGEIELLASGVRVALLQGLVSLNGISPQAFAEVDAIAGSPREVARALAAGELVGARVDCGAESCRIALTRRNGEDGRVIWADSVVTPRYDFAVAASAVTRQLQAGYRRYGLRADTSAVEVRGSDLEEFLRLRSRFNVPQEAATDSLLKGLEEIRRRSPRFLDAYLLEAEVARFRFWHSRDAKDLERASRRIAEARRLAPEDPRPLFTLVDLALARGEGGLAEETLTRLERLVPGDARLLDARSRLLEAQGKASQALELKRAAVRLQPSSNRLFNLSQAEYQLGEIAAARTHLDQLLQRTPDHFSGLSLLALLEMSNGDLDRAIRIYSRLVRRSPTPGAQANLGLAYFLARRYPEAVATYSRLLEEDPKNPSFVLNLADTYLAMGRSAEALEAYRQVIQLADSDLSTMPQHLTVKAQALAHLGQGPEAVSAIQEALRLAPDQGPVAYEAALVYSVLGEEDSSLVYAERALRSGLSQRWFSLPWFEPLQNHPGFRRILTEASSPLPAARK